MSSAPVADIRGHDIPAHERLFHEPTMDCRCGPIEQAGIDGETIIWFAVHRRFDHIVAGEVLT